MCQFVWRHIHKLRIAIAMWLRKLGRMVGKRVLDG